MEGEKLFNLGLLTLKPKHMPGTHFYQGGGAQHPLGPENPLEIIDFTDQG